jgi:hypothetical protein
VQPDVLVLPLDEQLVDARGRVGALRRGERPLLAVEPVCGHAVEAVEADLLEDERAAGPQVVADLVEHRAEVVDVV